jgi:crotonobetainyl-CoA:carnitine CoA-transferase CaiB-like acyl-CoA transferase
MTPLPLEGVRVVEFSHMVMGPSCGLILADLGAEVIKVEPPGKGDRTRYLTSTGTGFFPCFNRNKKSVQLDLETAEGLAAARRLILSADVMLENFRPGAFAEKGLDLEELRRANPRLITCSLKGFLTGPYENRTALDEVVQMMSGLAYMTGPAGRPLRAGAPINDMGGGAFAAIAILAALRQRELTGRGQHVQSGLFENAAWLVCTHVVQEAVTGETPLPMPAGKRAWGVYDVFQSSDGVALFIGVVTERQWEIFTAAMDEPTLRDPRFATNNDRSREREALIPIVAGMVARKPAAYWEELCVGAGLPFARVIAPGGLLEDPHLAAGGMVPTRLADGSETRIPALPVEMDGSRLGARSQPPAPGEHTEEVLRAIGLGTEEIAAATGRRLAAE